MEEMSIIIQGKHLFQEQCTLDKDFITKLVFSEKNMTYLLHSAVNVDLALLKSEININMRMTKSITENKYVTDLDVINLQHNTTLCQKSDMFIKKNSRNSCIFSK